jgi:hypothetical protein
MNSLAQERKKLRRLITHRQPDRILINHSLILKPAIDSMILLKNLESLIVKRLMSNNRNRKGVIQREVTVKRVKSIDFLFSSPDQPSQNSP